MCAIFASNLPKYHKIVLCLPACLHMCMCLFVSVCMPVWKINRCCKVHKFIMYIKQQKWSESKMKYSNMPSSKISWLFVLPLTDYIRNVGIFFLHCAQLLLGSFLDRISVLLSLCIFLCTNIRSVCCVLWLQIFNTIPFAIRAETTLLNASERRENTLRKKTASWASLFVFFAVGFASQENEIV